MWTKDAWISRLNPVEQVGEGPAGSPAEESHEGHNHDHAGHSEASSIELSPSGLENIGFEPFTVEPCAYARRLNVPSVVVEVPGRSQVHITAPLTGVIEEVFVSQGEAVEAGQKLFRMRLTHEELVSAQREFLETLSKLGVAARELTRLSALDKGVVAGKRILEQEYEQDRLQVALDASRQAMLLHGLTEEQVEEVRRSGRMFREIVVRAPAHSATDKSCESPHLFTVQNLGVALGEHVNLGRELALLSDHCELLIEALAFEDDAASIRHAAEAGLPVEAKQLGRTSSGDQPTGLEILYVAGGIDLESRAFKVYVRLPNRIALDKTGPRGARFLEWAFKPGQRMELSIPVETWENQIVVPTTAVVDEGAEAYVYRQNGDHFERVPVHIRYRDQNAVVIANDGAVFSGDVIAGDGAYQMHLALKNKSGGAIDPHAGHNH
ncbi:HlyD family secretion protein [Planctomycetes bacterium K2D]|uniref:HlyD family secretion protein n=2 Tax=Botrimarina mediterranea TaxID=2528022 RepID=A0A518K7E2_9BACT|nr:HlyD family secretion protein [Botrimarina mediterranea]QDV78289.1 HlyD family secretion protein [Planctomycetes bacterium K2D]